ncbi:MAG: amino acid adenylation domain-containing protein [Enhydrobacter sp.]|nr:amino acid adenylation domain-containing protein [Enhydrobacter sp.]
MSKLPENAIAVIGMAGRFPGADGIDQFWRNLMAGATSIRSFSEAELQDAFPAEVRGDASFVRARAILDDVDRFDAEFFGMLPREAALTDPQHRLLLECAWTALEDAGYDPQRIAGSVGVFAGCSMNTYLLTHVLAERLDADSFASNYQVGSYDALLGSLSDTLATRIAYKLGLRGPAMTVQSACSTSLLAVAQACQSLLLYQADMALAGGVSITFPQKRGYLHQEGGMVSPDGTCRPFDASAAGTVFGDGVGMVLLKRLAEAVEDGDHIYAVIRGSAVNNDGGNKVGFTAPSVGGQGEVIASALANAEVDSRSIGYVECHGTATPLGDPIEFAGLVQGFGGDRVSRPFCALGSAKANIGHLDAAAGVVGLIKAVLALRHRQIPPLTNFRTPNPHLGLEGTPFYFPTVPAPWPEADSLRRAGVSSFGVGGTNVHVVLEEAPARHAVERSAARRHVLPLSARTDAAVTAIAGRLADHLVAHPEDALDDVAWTLKVGRRGFERRAAVTASSHEEAIVALRALPSPSAGKAAPLVFLFPGQGAQYPGMAAGLYRRHALFRDLLDEGIDHSTPIVGEALRAQLLDLKATAGDATLLAQPSLFVFEYALARLWMSAGVIPSVLVGHSVGEFVAACLAGVFSFSDGCRLVAERARLMQALPPGAMLAVRLPEADLLAELGDALDLAAVNAPSLSVASGPVAAIEALKERLAARGVPCRQLSVSHAFHSRALDAAVDGLVSIAEAIPLATPAIPFVSTVTGLWAGATEAADPRYWARHCRAPVRFADALAAAARDGAPFLLEVGPGSTLSALAPQVVDRHRLVGVGPSLAGHDDDDLAPAQAALWKAGLDLDWHAITPASGRRLALPTYPFQRSRHWIERRSMVQPAVPLPVASSRVPTAALPPEPAMAPAFEAPIIEIMQSLSGMSDLDPATSFVELGFDSLLLGQVARAVEKKFKVRITFRQLLQDYRSAAQLAAHLEMVVPSTAVQPAPVLPSAPVPATPPAASVSAPADALASLAQAQLQAMNTLFAEQLRAFQGRTTLPAVVDASAPSRPTSTPVPQPAHDAGARVQLPRGAGKGAGTLNAAQQAFVDDLARRIGARAPLAKSSTQQHRAVLADPRTVAGFRREWKELVFPLIAARGYGSKIRDVDGNEYIDLVNGYGQTMFGHSPDFVTAALSAQLEDGFPIGPQSPLAGEVAALVSELTGNERVTFCNTGSEAVMAAMRVARAVTGRDRVVVFAGDYHGQFDEVLVKSGGNPARGALPVAPGIPDESVANVTVLPYGEPASLDWVEANGETIAAVLVEPVQSRHPLLRPQAFLQRLRAITQAHGAALVFDEIVTGFRVHPGGMQAVFGIRADMATYGKVVGGGMPIGILAGTPRFMDALDGGIWRYGDDSVPETAPTFFAGTFVRHPLALAAAKAVLLHLKSAGPGLQDALATRMGGLVERLNGDLARRGMTTRIEGYSSWFFVNFATENSLLSLFWPQARLLGLHVQEAYPCFLTTAHSDEDIAEIERIFKASLDALEQGGILDGGRTDGPAATVDSAPLTEPQLEILAAAQLGDDVSCAFNESISIDFAGTLDIAALEAAVNAVLARHQALRGHVGRSDERMHFAAGFTLSLDVRDLSAELHPDEALKALVAADARTAFDLWNGPLVRAALVRLAADRHVLLFTAHHIVCDGWSMNVVLNDLAGLYNGGRAPTGLPPAPLFASYARAQAEGSGSRDDDLDYWTKQFADLPSLPELPTDRARPAERSYSGATWSTQFDAALHADLKKTAAAQRATLFAVLFTALQVVLGKLSGSADIVLGVPVAGQSLDDDHAELVGHCVNFLPFRAPLDWDAPFARHVGAVSRRLLDGFDHARCTYGTLVRALPLQRVSNRLPLTEIQFNLERLRDDLDFGGASAKVTPNAKAAVNSDLSINVTESAAGLRIDCDYNTGLFDEETIGRWVGHYRRVLEALCAAPDTILSRLPILSAEQQRFVLDTVNATEVDYPRDRCIHDLFAARAAATPEAIACVDGAGEMTYGELDRQSTLLAREILATSPVRGGRMAVAVDRSRALPVALLAVMKAGHAYVPLDPDQPIGRLRQIATAADVQGIVCQDERLAVLAPAALMLRLERHHHEPPAEAGLPAVSSDASAYILFTSGSTGAPKGVEILHRSLTNIICDVVRRCEIDGSDRFVASSAVTFDAAVAEMFSPLIAGGAVIMADRDVVRSGFGLVELLEAKAATLMLAPPTLWRILLEAGFSSKPGLKMIAGGESLPRDVADDLLAGGGRLWNLYGPTETTFCSAGGEILPGQSRITIGTPMANTQLYVLDDRDTVVPPGVVGSLFIGGAGLAKGYVNRPDLTEQSFRMLSLEGRSPQRLYRTGDLALLLPSGHFELRGRADRQVKLRGFRIELEEIESVLRKEPGVTDCVVLLRGDAGPDPALVAYVVGQADPTRLADGLATVLPDYMVPAHWVRLDVLPLTSSGKVDRAALAPPSPAAAAPAPAETPRTTLETSIAEVWAGVLGRPDVPTNVPLFSLGADSLQVFRIAARFRQQGIAAEARDLMRNPTVSALASQLAGAPPPPSSPPDDKGPSLAAFRRGAGRRGVRP